MKPSLICHSERSEAEFDETPSSAKSPSFRTTETLRQAQGDNFGGEGIA